MEKLKHFRPIFRPHPQISHSSRTGKLITYGGRSGGGETPTAVARVVRGQGRGRREVGRRDQGPFGGCFGGLGGR